MKKKLMAGIFIIPVAFGIISLSEASIPKEIRTTNVTDSQITLSWITDVVETCWVNYGQTPALGQTAYDTRGQNTVDDTHYVNITGLGPETLYYFELVSGTTVDNNNGVYYQCRTGTNIKPSGLDYAFGKVFKSDAQTYATGTIVYFKLSDADSKGSPGESAVWSVLVDSNGYWSENLINIRTQNLNGFFNYSIDGGDRLVLFAQGAKDGTATLIVATNQDSPAPDIILSTDHIKPSTINTLEIKQVTSNSITLKWIAPGDDGNQGQAFLYDIRWSLSPINEGNFGNATQVQGEILPGTAGTQQEFKVPGLSPNTFYYLAMKTRDEANNWSDLSNVVAAKTPPPPNSMLDWTGENNFVDDGLRLDLGTIGTNFVYMVKYTHPNNLPPARGEPKIILYKGTIPLGTYSTMYVKGSFSTGAIYTYSKVFQENGEYGYQFYAQGAEGEPTSLTRGPIVMDMGTGVRITNQTDAQWTVSWITSQPATGSIKYGVNPLSLNMTGYDDRGTEFNGKTHYVTVKGLIPETLYYFDVVSGGVVDNNYGSHYSVWTGKSFINSGIDMVYGMVIKQGGQATAKDALVYLTLKDNDGQGSPNTSAPVSALVQENGYWMADLVNVRTFNLSSQFNYSSTADELYLFVNGVDEGIGSKIIATKDDSPALPIELCRDVVAPASITTLQVIKAGIGSITLRWQATGDDKNIGQAAIYDLRYATFTITESSWGLTEEVKSEPTPANSGTFQEFMVTGLSPGTTYYFGLKVIDEVWNMSELSKIVEGSTTPEVKHNPILDWVGEGEYLKDGVFPDNGNIDRIFTFQVKYIDADGDAPLTGEPKVIIYKDGLFIGTYSMSYVQGTSATGIVYKFSQFLPTPGTYSYRFFATDAAGTATLIQQGPIVSGIPYRETNITDAQFTISWTSNKQEIGTVNYGTNPNSLNLSDFDDRGIGYSDDTHHISITGLSANTLYYYDVVSGGVVDNNNGFHYVVKTGASIIPKPENWLVQGEVYKQGRLEYADGAIVYIQLGDVDRIGESGSSALASVLVANGQWLYNLVNLRCVDGQSFFDDYTADKDNLYLFAEGGLEGTDTQTIYPTNGNPSPYMELSRDITPPGTTTLLATNTTAVSTTLFWLSAGDDNHLGTPTIYDIRYSTGVINEDTWATARQVGHEPPTGVAGSPQQLTITGLNPTTLYYLGLKTIDEAGNVSLLVIATVTTAPHPPPMLKWSGEEGYIEDGLEPERGSDETIFTYKVAYFHETNFPPANGFPKLHIQRLGNELNDSPYELQEIDRTDTEYTDGKLYKCLKTFSLPGTYTYWFEAKDTLGVTAKGTPTRPSPGPSVGRIPVLTWTNEAGYKSDGIEPGTSNVGATFTYRINFTHFQNIPPAQGYPRVYIYLGTNPIQNSPFPMEEGNPQDIDWTDGKIYILSIPLNTAGKYYYRFEAKDINDFLAEGEPIQTKTGPIVAMAPVLNWVEQEGYRTDGIEPNTGIRTTIFTYKVQYSDADNTPPDSYSPKLYVLKGGEVVYQRKLYRESGNDYVTGMVYVTKLPLVFASDYYSYYFEAKNTLGVFAIGAPTTISPGPLVTGPNYPPRLFWVGGQEYVMDGLDPEIGNPGTIFNYRIKYSDINADPPKQGYPIIYVYKSNVFIGTKTMDYLYGSFTSGAVYGATSTFETTGIYQYKFEARDKKDLPYSTVLKSGPIISHAPLLEWTGGEGYNSDGLEPEVGTVNLTAFTYKVSYKDIDNDPPDNRYPVVHIFKDGKDIPGSPYKMEAIDSNDVLYTDGKGYRLIKVFDQAGTFTYQFEAYDYLRIKAMGNPTNISPSPVVRSIPTLNWTCEPGYVNNGLEPELGDLQTTFTWRVNYTDMDGDAPLSNYPVVHILKGGMEIEHSPFILNAVDTNDVNYKDGKLFTYSSLLADTGTYSYYFEAYDSLHNQATGSATLLKYGPSIISSPILIWAGTQGYINDGLDPGTGTFQRTTFTYKVLYIDPEGNPPAYSYPRVHIFLGGAPLYYGGQWMYIQEGNDYKRGVTYSFPITFPIGSRHYTYYFEAENVKGIAAIGEPTLEHDGPIVDGPNFKPVLFWSPNQGFISDGLDPEVGTPGTKFTYQIRYIDGNGDPPDNNYPLVYIYKNTVLMATLTMNLVSGNFLQGAIYAYSTSFPEKDQYQYQFRAQDEQGGEVLFPPNSFMSGPTVSGSPKLEWFGQEGFIDDGLEPETGTLGTTFTYRVIYFDEDNELPLIGFPKVQIQKGKVDVLYTQMLETDPQDNQYTDGKAYEYFYPLKSPGRYTYRFEAKDTSGLYALGSPTIFHSGPDVISIPSLTWVGVDKFMTDGLDPEVGTPGTKWTFRITYIDRGNLPPATGSPKVNIFLNHQFYISFGMQAEDIFDDDWSDGKIYRIAFLLPSGSYTYKFEAENIYGAKAVGQPVLWKQDGPLVSSVPSLNWIGAGDYIQSGVSPPSGTMGTEFIYMIDYTDIDNDPPLNGFPKIEILCNGVKISSSPFTMVETSSTDTTHTDGKRYKLVKYLPAPGTYSYQFIAQDTNGFLATGEPTIQRIGPLFMDVPVMEWVGQEPYLKDGIDPGSGTTNSLFTYKVKYRDVNNSPPASGYPRLYILIDGVIFPLYPNGVVLRSEGGVDYQSGVIYRSNPLKLPMASTKYTYYFIAKNTQGKMANGTPTTIQSGPEVTGQNLRPMLLWANQPGYTSDGLEPGAGTSGAEFTYLIIYKDLNGDEPYPGHPLLHIYKDQNFIGTYTMERQSGTFNSGALYRYKITLVENGNYKYKFEAKDIKGADCLSSPQTFFTPGPRIGSPPQLEWLGTGSFQSDGLDPQTGIANETIFTYRVKYQDNENDPPASGYPKIHIVKGGVEIQGSPLPLEQVDTNDKDYQNGKEYQLFKKLILAGSDYSYYFEAKDTYGVYAEGTPTYSVGGPVVTGEPILNWAKDLSGYMDDGLEPEFGTPGTSFIYRISYMNPANDPPGTNSPRLHIFKAGVELPNSPWIMVQENPDTNYEDGKLYSCPISLGTGTYTYRFAAESNGGIPATGTATFIKDGPRVTLAPVLDWVNKPGYVTDGLDPEAGSATTTFVYRVLYTDTEPPAAGYPKVHILKANKEIAGSPFGMQETLPGDTYADGKEYECSRILTGTGKDYEYFFEAKDAIGVPAVGNAPVTSRPNAPVITDAPILNWVQAENYVTDGLHPELGTWGTKFTYKVTYSDANNDLPNQNFPKVHILKAGAEISGSPFLMIAATASDQNCMDGKDYYFVQTLPYTGRDYTYFFEAEDTWGIKASGAPTLQKDAPDVSRAPTLSWSGQPGFIEDGLEPEIGTQGTKFTYQVKYEDADGDPPYSGFPKVHIYTGNNPIQNSPFPMQLINNGIYQYQTNLAIGTYSYFFEAKDSYQLQAIGTPTAPLNKPVVTDAPILDWVQEPGFDTDGLNPNSGNSETRFTYKINYIDNNNNSPADWYPKVIIYKGVTVLGTYSMKEVDDKDITYTDGKLYYYWGQFPESSLDYKYKFIAKDSLGMDAVGKIQLNAGPLVNNPPTLNWTGESGYTNDGIEPDYGTTKDVYTYRIKYVDEDNHPPSGGYPKLYIYSKGTLTNGSPITMNVVNPNDGTYTDGKLYTFSTNFSEGTYTYKFEAKDIYSAEVMTSIKSGPSVSDAPSLSWVNQDGFGTDGVNPDPGQTTNKFTYKILYTDVNNLPPADGYPKLYICIGDVVIYPGYILTKEGGDSYSTGVAYAFHEIYLSYASEAYSYYFEAKNRNNVVAIGQPTTSHSGPKVEGPNHSPFLFSTGEKEYSFDGVHPDAASPGIFTFHVAYRDNNVNPPAPGYPAVVISKNNIPYGLGTYSMMYLNGGYFKGATYSTNITLNATGSYKYKFYAKDTKGAEAVGPFSILKIGPKVSHAPKLEWAGSPNFQTDGLDPEEGIVGQTYFTFKVKYKDEDGDAPATGYPKIYIVNNEIPLGNVQMVPEPGGDYKTGKIYYFMLRLGVVSDKYKYYFEAKDVMGVLALGTPTLQKSGPIVKPRPPASPQTTQSLDSLEIFNYPNPHSGKTTICAKTNLTDVDVDMQVAVYNLVGELIWEKRESVSSSVEGKAEILWEAKDIASGVYLYRVTVTYQGKTLQKISKMAITR
ncbi:MAG: hypothetical protein QME42_00165 [bacterium]|nr:hypothetical protein [bacterium]